MLNIHDKINELTRDELREVFNDSEAIRSAVYDWLKESDANYVGDQIEVYREYIAFDVTQWGRVYAHTVKSAYSYGDMAEVIRRSPYSYPVTIENDLARLELLALYAEACPWYYLPECLENEIEKRAQNICDLLADDFETCLDYEYDADELADYFADCPENFINDDPEAVVRFMERKFAAQCEAYTNGYTSAVSEIMARGDVFTGRTDDEKILAVEWQFPGGLGAYLTDSLRPAFLAGLDDAFYAIERMTNPENVVTVRTY